MFCIGGGWFTYQNQPKLNHKFIASYKMCILFCTYGIFVTKYQDQETATSSLTIASNLSQSVSYFLLHPMNVRILDKFDFQLGFQIGILTFCRDHLHNQGVGVNLVSSLGTLTMCLSFYCNINGTIIISHLAKQGEL